MNKLFIQRDLNFLVPKTELTRVLPYLGKASLDLRTKLGRTIEWNLLYCKLKVIFKSKCRLNTVFCFKDSLEKKICSGIIYRVVTVVTQRVVTARLLIAEKPSVTFIPEGLNTWGSPFLQENESKTLNSVQYLTIYCSEMAR